MANRQLTTPLIIDGGKVLPLHRVPLDELFRTEDWLQQLLFAHPSLLPADQIDPAFDDLVPVAREVRTASGPVDLLYVSPKGYLTLVETKLWRNPEARRSVVGQIIDYAKDIARWSYDDLVAATRRAGARSVDPILEAARGPDEGFDSTRFIDTVSRNLQRGNFLLMIVGDGIQEGVEHMAEFLQRTPQLGFTLGLVEVALYRLHENQDEPLFVQPRVIARTREITRAIIEFSNVNAADVRVTLPDAIDESRTATGRTSGPPRPRRSLDEAAFYAELSAAVGSTVAELAKQALNEADQHGLKIDWGDAGPLLKYIDEDTGDFFTLGALTRDGTLGSTSRLYDRCRGLNLPDDVWRNYFTRVAALVPGASYRTFKTRSGYEYVDLVHDGERGLPLGPLLNRLPDWFDAMDLTMDEIRTVLKGR